MVNGSGYVPRGIRLSQRINAELILEFMLYAEQIFQMSTLLTKFNDEQCELEEALSPVKDCYGLIDNLLILESYREGNTKLKYSYYIL